MYYQLYLHMLMLAFITWLTSYLSGFSTVKSLFPFSFGRKSLYAAHIESGHVCSPP